ncbi:GNAT family N-acetyltransferase [Anaerocolumna xylanovorans]|nr:GNAT family N-acetyltransferase [Anaerocolumna xylanovorans]
MRIEQAVSGDLDEIVSVLDEVTLKLLDEGIHQWKYPWYKEDVKKELDYQYVVKKQNKIIALFSIRPLGKNNFMAEAGEKDFYLYRVAVMPEFQNQQIEKEILGFVKKLCRHDKINIYFDCDYENEKQRQFYKTEGFYELGNFSEKDYYVSVYRFLREDTSAKNRFKNITRKRKRELRIVRKVVLAALLVVLLINFKTIIKLFDNRIHMTPAVMVGEFAYWRNEEADTAILPEDVIDTGEIKKIVDIDQWPDQPMEAVGIPPKMAGASVYQSGDLEKVYIYYPKQKQYLAFQKESTIANNNYKNGFYKKLLKNCASEDVIPLDKIPEDYTFEQAKKDKLAILYNINLEMKTEGKEYFAAFLKSAETKGKAYVRITQMIGSDVKSYTYIDLFYYKKNYYYFVSGNPDMYNARFSYLKAFELPGVDRTSGTIYLLCQSDTKTISHYTKNTVDRTNNYALAFFIPGTEKYPQ